MKTVIVALDKIFLDRAKAEEKKEKEGKGQAIIEEIDFLHALDHYDEEPFELEFGDEYNSPINLSYKVNTDTTIVAYRSPTEISVYSGGRANDGVIRNALQTSRSIFLAIASVAKDHWKKSGEHYVEREYPEWYRKNVLQGKPA